MLFDFVVQFVIRATSRKLAAEPRCKNTKSPHASPARRQTEQTADDTRNSLPVFRFLAELFAPRTCDGVELGLAIVLRETPGRRYPCALLQPQQRRVDRSFVQPQNIVADLFDAPGNSITVLRPHGIESLQNHKIEGALQYFRFSFCHQLSIS